MVLATTMVPCTVCVLMMLPFPPLVAHRVESEIMSIDTAGSDSIQKGQVTEGAIHNKSSTNETLAVLPNPPQLPSIWRQKFSLVNVLGEGSFGRVLKCRLNCAGEYQWT
mmetsp:Transcript_5338/g.7398  ORF Transcript_5338/g.7398 Transcript_5338/m.7398 type:complete len:109 (-) Transcript_5338:1-327(-)